MFSLRFKTLKLASRLSSMGGFTLTELLVAGALTATAVGVSGVGLASIISSSTDSGNQNERRVELNRSLEFIAAEVRQAQRIEPDADLDLGTRAANFDSNFLANGKVPVLTLEIPGVNQRVIYYVAAANGPWRGPQVVYRWGPRFDLNGAYKDPGNPSAWQAEPLIDLISDQASTPSCDSGWQPGSPNTKGFYACISPTGKIASVHADGSLRKILGRDETYSLETKVSTRITPATTPTFPTPISSSPSTTTTSLSTVTISTLGGAIQCGRNSTLVPVSGEVEFHSGSNGLTKTMPLPDAPNPPDAPRPDMVEKDVPPDTNLTITGNFNNCGRRVSVHSETDKGRQVLVLKNGDTLPTFKPFSGQQESSKYLDAKNPENGNKPYLEVINSSSPNKSYRVSLASNQLIFLFELGVDYDNRRKMNNQEAGFDMQDLIIVATITPTTETTSTVTPVP
ncbi:MAG: type II secretion system protein J [Thermosynechococcaceae cyanobacterium]